MHAALEPHVRLALGCITREYPNQVSLGLGCAEDLRHPRELTPAFYGCFDWHSAVHSHWLLVRFLHVAGGGALDDEVRAALAGNLTALNLEQELAHLKSRPTFERPYGIAWLLALAAELR